MSRAFLVISTAFFTGLRATLYVCVPRSLPLGLFWGELGMRLRTREASLLRRRRKFMVCSESQFLSDSPGESEYPSQKLGTAIGNCPLGLNQDANETDGIPRRHTLVRTRNIYVANLRTGLPPNQRIGNIQTAALRAWHCAFRRADCAGGGGRFFCPFQTATLVMPACLTNPKFAHRSACDS